MTGGAPGRVGLDQLRKEIKAERGLIYRYLVGLAIDASCCRDHPKISSEKKSGVVSVALPNYTLEFGVENGLLKLRVIECTDPGGD